MTDFKESRTGWADHNLQLPCFPRRGAFIQATADIFISLDRYESCASVWHIKKLC